LASRKVVGRVVIEDVGRRYQRVLGEGARRNWLAGEDVQREWQDVITEAVEIERHRADHDAAAVARVELLAIVHAAVDRPVDAVAYDGGVRQAAGRLEGRLRRQRRRVVRGGDEELRAGLARDEP